MILLAILAAGALNVDQLSPQRFYVSGIGQGMTLAEYNAMIANGRFRSKPIGPDRFHASIDGQDIFVDFCEGRVVSLIADYHSGDWVASLKRLEALGFKWGAPLVIENPNTSSLRSGSMTLSVTAPKGYSYFVSPMIKAASVPERELASYQLMFQSVQNPCR